MATKKAPESTPVEGIKEQIEQIEQAPAPAPPPAPAAGLSSDQIQAAVLAMLENPQTAEMVREKMGAAKLTKRDVSQQTNADAALIVAQYGDIVRDTSKPFEPVFPEGIEENPQARAMALAAWKRGYQNGERGAFEIDDHPELTAAGPDLGGF